MSKMSRKFCRVGTLILTTQL